MAKAKPQMSLSLPGEKAQPEPQPEPKKKSDKKRRPLGLYLRNDVLAAVQEIATENGQAVHGIVTFAVTYFIKQYRAGKVKIETETRQRLKLDL